MSPATQRGWLAAHRWSGVFCSVLLLFVAITGLPLIFHEEIDIALGDTPPAARTLTGPELPLDQMVAIAKAERAGTEAWSIYPSYVPGVYGIGVEPTPATGEEVSLEDVDVVLLDARSGEVLGKQKAGTVFTSWLLHLHGEMLLGLPGTLFLGFVALALVICLVSGVVIYGPYTRDRFGEIRQARSSRLVWQDVHKLMGAAVLAWALVVGVTGMINTWSGLLLSSWRAEAFAPLNGAGADRPLVVTPSQALSTALQRHPDKELFFMAAPGSDFADPTHYTVLLRGQTAWESKMYHPVLVNAATGAVASDMPMPWYATMLMVAEPLHFGDYGGLPLKLLWAFLDILLIVANASGLYLWLAKPKAVRATGRVPA